MGFAHLALGRTVFHLASTVGLPLFEAELAEFARQVGASRTTQIVMVEHARAQYPRVALIIVAQIEVSGTDETEYTASGGELMIYEPWRIEDGALAPLAFAYVPPSR